MQAIILILLVLLLAYYLAIEPFRGRYRSGYRPNKLMLWVLIVPIIPLGISEALWQVTEHKGTQIIKEVSGKPEAHLSCQRLAASWIDTTPGYEGYVAHDNPDTAIVKTRSCWKLQSYFLLPSRPSLEESLAFNTLLHEAFHVAGEWDEAQTECKAHSVHFDQAKKLGTYPAVAKENMRTYIMQIYPNMRREYVTADGCGGLHDMMLAE